MAALLSVMPHMSNDSLIDEPYAFIVAFEDSAYSVVDKANAFTPVLVFKAKLF